MILSPSTERQRAWLLAIVLAISAGAGTWVSVPTGGYDWSQAFAPAGRHWRPAPWEYAFPYLPWGALGLAPLAAFPDRLGNALLSALGALLMVAVLRRYGGRAWLALPIVLSPFGMRLFDLGQTDMLILAGLLLPAGFDLVVLAIKPQVAAGAILTRLVNAARGRELVRYLAPLVIVMAASVWVWPGWPAALLQTSLTHVGANWNAAPWPAGLPLGLALLWRAWRKNDDALGVLATPLLAPFFNVQTLVASLVILAARWPRWFGAAWLASWGIVVYLVRVGPLPHPLYLAGVALGSAAGLLYWGWRHWHTAAQARGEPVSQ
jgi:hypothetical protein